MLQAWSYAKTERLVGTLCNSAAAAAAAAVAVKNQLTAPKKEWNKRKDNRIREKGKIIVVATFFFVLLHFVFLYLTSASLTSHSAVLGTSSAASIAWMPGALNLWQKAACVATWSYSCFTRPRLSLSGKLLQISRAVLISFLLLFLYIFGFLFAGSPRQQEERKEKKERNKKRTWKQK